MVFSYLPSSHSAFEYLPDTTDSKPREWRLAMSEFCGIVAMVEASVHLVERSAIFVSFSFHVGNADRKMLWWVRVACAV